MFYLLKSKYAVFSNIKVTKINRSAVFGTPGGHFMKLAITDNLSFTDYYHGNSQ